MVTCLPSSAGDMIQVMRVHTDAWVPERASDGAAGYDLYSVEAVTAERGDLTPIRTGIAVAIPAHLCGRIAPRSSLMKEGLEAMPGVIDSDYRGEIIVIIKNLSGRSQVIDKGQRIAQLLLIHIATPDMEEV